jgi:hypothetical protein
MIFCNNLQETLQKAFLENNLSINIKPACIIVENSQNQKQEKIRQIIEMSGFCPLISSNKINKNFVFTIVPYKIPEFFLRSNFAIDNREHLRTIFQQIQYIVENFDDLEFPQKCELARTGLIQQTYVKARSDSLETAIQAFVKSYGISDCDVVRKEGYSAGKVFAVVSNNVPQLIVKVYSVASGQIIKDMWGQKAATELDLEYACIPKMLDLAKIQVLEQEYFLFVQECVSGISIWSLLFKLRQTSETKEKIQARNHATRILSSIGRGLREYHMKSTKCHAPLSSALANYLDVTTKAGLKFLDEHPEFNINSAELEKKIKRLRKQLDTQGIDWSFVHGDTHFGNFLYDIDTDTLSIFDLGEGANFADSCFRGTGVPMFDYIKIEEGIRVQAPNIGDEEVQNLLNAFSESYGGVPCSSEIHHYFFIIGTLWQACEYLTRLGSIPERFHNRLHRISCD